MSTDASVNPLHFDPSAVLVVDAHNGPELWSAAQWNEYVDQAERHQALISVKILDIHRPDPERPGYCGRCGAAESEGHTYLEDAEDVPAGDWVTTDTCRFCGMESGPDHEC
jgi:hypothetical protein